MSPELSWLLLMAGLAAVAVGVDKLVGASGSLRRAVGDPDRFDVFGDDEPAGHYDGDEWDELMAVADAVQDPARAVATCDLCLWELEAGWVEK